MAPKDVLAVIREFDTEHGRRPYWDAGPAYGPWAGGYFGGGILPGLLFGTLLGSMMSTPSYAADYGAGYGDFGGADFQGGDVSGTDFDHVLTLAATIVTSPPPHRTGRGQACARSSTPGSANNSCAGRATCPALIPSSERKPRKY